MPEKSFESVAAAAAPAIAAVNSAANSGANAVKAVIAKASGKDNRLVHRKIGDVFGFANSLYQSSPAAIRYGVDHFIALSRPVVDKVNPIALKAVSLADDGVDYVQSKLTVANTTATNARADLKEQLQLVSAQWFARVDAVLVPLHPTLAANVYITQAIEQFKAMIATAAIAAATKPEQKSVAVGSAGAASALTLPVFIARLKESLALLWDERLVPLSEAFFVAAKARYDEAASAASASGAAAKKTADEALVQIKSALGTTWNQQVVTIFESRVGTPSRDIYNRVIAKFVAVWESKEAAAAAKTNGSGASASADIKSAAGAAASGQEFVQSMRGSLGALWTDSLAAPILELYTAVKKQAEVNAASVRALAATANAESVTQQYTSLTAALSQQLHAVLSAAQTRAEELSHWSVRRLYKTGKGYVTSAVDQSSQHALKLSASTLDYVLPSDEVTAATAVRAASAAPAADQKEAAAAAPTSGGAASSADLASAASASGGRLTLRVLRDRASARVRARVNRAVAAGVSAGTRVVTESDALATKTSTQLSSYIGVNAYAEAKELVARTQTLLSALRRDTSSYVVDTTGQVSKDVTAIKAVQLQRVRTALTALSTEFEHHAATVKQLITRLKQSQTGIAVDSTVTPVVSRATTIRNRAVNAIRARLSEAVQKLHDLSLSAQSASDYVLDRELRAFPSDLLRLVRIVPTLLPPVVVNTATSAQTATATATAAASNRLRSVIAALIAVVQSVAAYTHITTKRRSASPTASAASAAAPIATPVAAAAPPSPTAAGAPAPAPAPAPVSGGVKQIAAAYESIASSAQTAAAASKSPAGKATSSAAAAAAPAEDDGEGEADEGEAENETEAEGEAEDDN